MRSPVCVCVRVCANCIADSAFCSRSSGSVVAASAVCLGCLFCNSQVSSSEKHRMDGRGHRCSTSCSTRLLQKHLAAPGGTFSYLFMGEKYSNQSFECLTHVLDESVTILPGCSVRVFARLQEHVLQQAVRRIFRCSATTSLQGLMEAGSTNLCQNDSTFEMLVPVRVQHTSVRRVVQTYSERMQECVDGVVANCFY